MGIGVRTLAVMSLIYGFTASPFLQVLHFVGILFVFLVVTGIPHFAFWTRGHESPGGVPDSP